MLVQPGPRRDARATRSGTTPPRSSPPRSSSPRGSRRSRRSGASTCSARPDVGPARDGPARVGERTILGRVWKTWHEKTRSSVFFNLESRLSFLASELVQAVLSGDDFRAERPHGRRRAGHRLHRHAAAHGRGDAAAAPAPARGVPAAADREPQARHADGRPKSAGCSCCSTSSPRSGTSRRWSATWRTSPATACAPCSAPRTRPGDPGLRRRPRARRQLPAAVYSASLSARSVERERAWPAARPRSAAARRATGLVRQGDDLADGGRDARWWRPASW